MFRDQTELALGDETDEHALHHQSAQRAVQDAQQSWLDAHAFYCLRISISPARPQFENGWLDFRGACVRRENLLARYAYRLLLVAYGPPVTSRQPRSLLDRYDC